MRDVVVLGLGNVLLADDGVGPAAVHAFERAYQASAGVRVLDGGTLGLALLGVLDARSALVIVDAVAADAPPGALLRLEGDDIAEAVATRLSPHQFGVADLLATARHLSCYPEEVVLLGLVPKTIELGLGLTPSVAQGIPGLVRAIADELARLRHPQISREVEDAAPQRSRVDVARALGL